MTQVCCLAAKLQQFTKRELVTWSMAMNRNSKDPLNARLSCASMRSASPTSLRVSTSNMDQPSSHSFASLKSTHPDPLKMHCHVTWCWRGGFHGKIEYMYFVSFGADTSTSQSRRNQGLACKRWRGILGEWVAIRSIGGRGSLTMHEHNTYHPRKTPSRKMHVKNQKIMMPVAPHRASL